MLKGDYNRFSFLLCYLHITFIPSYLKILPLSLIVSALQYKCRLLTRWFGLEPRAIVISLVCLTLWLSKTFSKSTRHKNADFPKLNRFFFFVKVVAWIIIRSVQYFCIGSYSAAVSVLFTRLREHNHLPWCYTIVLQRMLWSIMNCR